LDNEEDMSMKVVILAGGLGTRLSEETGLRPKPMIEIGGMPVLWHIMKIFAAHGLNEFIVCLGYKGYVIKEFFNNYFLHTSDVTIDLQANSVQVHNSKAEPWKITLVDTGAESMTGGRLKRIAGYLDPKERFCMTYGDGVGDINITDLIRFAKKRGTLATLTATQPGARFGALDLVEDSVRAFKEKPMGEAGWINGGFFVIDPKALSYIEGDNTVWENEPLERLAAEGQLSAYMHRGFWHPLDTLRDKKVLEEYWQSGKAPWKVWL
jgi:glucose-1-phosphate cytidylyltransferase